MRKMLFLLLVLISAQSFGQTKVEKDVKYQSVRLKKDDAEFLKLKDTAQKHMPEFLDMLKEHGADYNNYRFIVKSDFVEDTNHEHMWSQIVGYSNGVFRAVFIDSPFNLKKIKNGDKIAIKKTNVEDWAVFRNNERIAGDFSEKYLNSKSRDN
ncbi:DUF2314 domain-containing protein [Mucilaginibacter sp. OK283]|uniref:DUF2314 domain-containing protein n=1 Tax=Mucilaginibacter sp. OK283 TaxID=1881049 RepID=UPI0015A689D0|nr:DUF2314 domain-containing protein [Mucilaginibacter sp. OK283]